VVVECEELVLAGRWRPAEGFAGEAGTEEGRTAEPEEFFDAGVGVGLEGEAAVGGVIGVDRVADIGSWGGDARRFAFAGEGVGVSGIGPWGWLASGQAGALEEAGDFVWPEFEHGADDGA
jgi:hypothetical protein